MSSFKFPRITTRTFIGSHRVVRSVFLICCGLLLASISLPIWLRWIPKLHLLRGPRPQPETGGENISDGQVRSLGDEDSATSGARDITSGNGDRSRWLAFPLLFSPWRRGPSRDKSVPPLTKYGIQILHDDRDATVEYVLALPWP